MKYFNGFSLKNEKELFKEFIVESDYNVVGFSYGAIKAMEYTLKSDKRVNKLILLSPAFFQTESTEFKQNQLTYFEQNHKVYVKTFLRNVIFPSKVKLTPYLNIGTKEELKELVYYVWDKEKLQKLIDKGITIEVFLGDRDKIINYKEALSFFKSVGCTIYILKNYGHILGE